MLVTRDHIPQQLWPNSSRQRRTRMIIYEKRFQASRVLSPDVPYCCWRRPFPGGEAYPGEYFYSSPVLLRRRFGEMGEN